jgi:hypothetical protein
MDWDHLHNIFKNKDDKPELEDYILLSRDNLDNLELGMHIKYIKSEYDEKKRKYIDRLASGGFLVKVLNGDKIVNMVLLLKVGSSLIKLRYIKYKIYGRKIVKNKSNLIDDFNNDTEFIQKKEEVINKYRQKLINNKNKNNKNHTVIFETND